MNDKQKELQQQWLKQHTLTWTQNKKMIESKLERARQMSEAIRRREEQLKEHWLQVCIGNASLPALKTWAINEGVLPDEKFVAITQMVKR